MCFVCAHSKHSWLWVYTYTEDKCFSSVVLEDCCIDHFDITFKSTYIYTRIPWFYVFLSTEINRILVNTVIFVLYACPFWYVLVHHLCRRPLDSKLPGVARGALLYITLVDALLLMSLLVCVFHLLRQYCHGWSYSIHKRICNSICYRWLYVSHLTDGD